MRAGHKLFDGNQLANRVAFYRFADFFEPAFFFAAAFLLEPFFLGEGFFLAVFFLAPFLAPLPKAFSQLSEYCLFEPLCNTVTCHSSNLRTLDGLG